MNDFDYEELDRAMNDLYNELDRPTKSTQPKAKSMRSQGHFMDMVHPSSDAMVQRKPNFAAERQAQITIAKEESADEKASEPAKPNKIAVAIIDEDTTSIAKASEETGRSKPVPRSAPTSAPKPTATRRVVQTSNANRRTKRDLAQPLPIVATATTLDTASHIDKTYETPFLPDIKIEKKPLGEARTNIPAVNHSIAITRKPATNHNSSSQRHSARASLDGNNSDTSMVAKEKAVTQSVRRRNGPNRAVRFVGWLFAFIGVIAAGVVVGLLFYYYGF
ncbi:MAG: hypothetical protein Q4C83_02600 [Candidatus Saccharibacteria bacterium]|nr:hypothetical protein [Candidatus Saccharibacteria bacterium]